jgi:Na+-driven multidrug efflux pump
MQKSSISYILKLSIPIFFANLAIPLVGIIDTTLLVVIPLRNTGGFITKIVLY